MEQVTVCSQVEREREGERERERERGRGRESEKERQRDRERETIGIPDTAVDALNHVTNSCKTGKLMGTGRKEKKESGRMNE